MKLKVENIKLRTLIVEATYQDAFSKIKKGDTLIIKSGAGSYNVEVVDSFTNQVVIAWKDQNFMITNNSLNGDNLITRRFIPNSGGKTVNGPTIKGVFNIVIKRGDNVVSGVSISKGRSEPVEKQQSKKQKVDKGRYDELRGVIKSLSEDDTLKVTVGKLITTGRDKGSLAKNTVAELTFIVEKLLGPKIKIKLHRLGGEASNKYEFLKTKPIFLDADAIEPSGQGFILNYKYKNKDGTYDKGVIKNVFGVENGGMVEPDVPEEVEDGDSNGLSNSEKLDIIKSSPMLKRRYLGNPSLFNKIFNKQGVSPVGDISRLFGADEASLSNVKKGDKIIFIYSGNIINVAKDLYFQSKERYVGKYLGDNRLIVKSSNRKDAIEFEILGGVDEDGIAVVNVKHKSIKDNIANSKLLKRAKIKIIEED